MKKLLIPFLKIAGNLKTRSIFRDNLSFLKYILFSFIAEYKITYIFYNREYLIKFGLKECGKKFIYARLDKHDLDCLKYVFLDKYHLPYNRTLKEGRIVDLGANIGYVALHLNYLYPEKNILTVEMSSKNYEVLKLNVGDIKNIHRVNTAIWHENTTIFFDPNVDNDAFAARAIGSKDTEMSTARTIRDIMDDYKIDFISFLKIDIEGAEDNLLRMYSTDRLNQVHSVNLEIHDENIEYYERVFLEKQFSIYKNNHPASILAIK